MGRPFNFVLLLVFIGSCRCQDDVRLVGGSGPKEGRVEVFIAGEWGTICDDLWDINDANVVCRQLGYSGAVMTRDYAYFGQGSGRIWLDNVECTGNEEFLADCPKNDFGNHNCQHFEDAGVECQMQGEDAVTEVTRTIEDIRLVDGSSATEGRVEVFVDGRWGTVCDDEWDINDATVVCRQLGYPGADSAEVFALFGEGSDPIWLDNVGCSGEEENLNDCPKNGFEEHNCNHYEDAGVRCTSTETVASTESTESSNERFREDYRCGGDYLAPNGEVAECDPDSIYTCCSSENLCAMRRDKCDCEGCIDYGHPAIKDVRLVGSDDPNAGRIEVLVRGEWGTVCDDDWELADAEVICRMMGYTGVIDFYFSAQFGSGTGPIWIDDLACSGTENSLNDCLKSRLGNHNCGHGEDAGVRCTVEWTVETSAITDIRLVGSDDPNAGRIEVLVRGEWGNVCDDGWRTVDAEVVCRMLGYTGLIDYYFAAHFGSGTGPIWIDDLACSGTENSLNDCLKSRLGNHNCGHNEDASVRCTVERTVGTVETSAPPVIEDIRLAEGTTENVGRVEVLINGEWGTVCDDLFDQNDADVVCRQLGYAGASYFRTSAFFGIGEGPIWLDDIECTGSEQSLEECQKNEIGEENCGHSEDVGVGCITQDGGISTGEQTIKDIRLVGGESENEGRVEVLVEDQWGTVCDDLWHLEDAEVVCRQLGYSGASAYLRGATFGEGTGLIWLDNVECAGDETSLNDCKMNDIGDENCGHFEDAGVTCVSDVTLAPTPATSTQRWRDDYQCGGTLLAPYGGTAECNPNGPNPCCSPFGWCDVTPSHCECDGCIDYRVTRTTPAPPVIQDIRLADGRTVNMGRVEVQVNGVWGTVCDDLWDMNDATVTCKQLGFPGAESARKNSYFGTGSSIIWLDNVECVGDETTLDECPKNDIGNEDCTGSEHAGVVCHPYDTPPASATNRWRADYRCGGEFYAPNGEIAECDPEGTNPCCSPYNWCDVTPSHCECSGCTDYRVIDVSSTDAWRDDYQCGGDYLAPNGEVAQCNPDGIYPCCSPYNWCGITTDHCDCEGCIDYRETATATASPIIEDVRLADGTTVNMGRVEVKVNGVWGTVCDDLWDIDDATVTCKQLGYPGAEAARQDSYFGTGSDTIWLDNVECIGDETTLDECPKNDIGDENCGGSEHAGVVCLPWETPPASATNRWRADYRCGGEFYAPNGEIAECDPEGTNPCCSPYNWCDVTPSHCECEDCIDYRVTDASTQRWRDDYQCGDGFIAPYGGVAECNPNGPNPCCSPHNWCDVTPSHCECDGCIDYRVTATQQRWRDDFRCGSDFLAPNGEAAECDPNGPNPCCSEYGWCDVTSSHCQCDRCIDYRMTRYQDIRLNGGQSENEGRVEVLVNGEWGTVCDDVWDLDDATVACKELGYPGAESYFTNSHFGGGAGNTWLDNVECTGNEESLNDCQKNTIGDHNCGHDEDAGVKCTLPDSSTQRWRDDYQCGGRFIAPYGGIAECNPNGPNPCCSPHNWCDVTPSHCECDGCTDYRLIYNTQTRYREDYRCGGDFLASNREVAECDPYGIYPCCSPYNWCGNTADHCYCDGCIDYRNQGYQDIRLDGGQSDNEGRVEVFVNGEWGTVCDDVWDLNDATVACKELGYPGAEIYFTNSHFGGGAGNTWLDNVECTGNETSLNDCQKNTIGEHNCGHDEDAGVKCTLPGYQEIRLTDGQSENEGRVEVLVNGVWGTVCDDLWDLNDATVACKELGYSGAESVLINSHFGGGTGNTWLDNVECTGNEASLNDCQKNAIGDHNCGHDEDAGVKCTTPGYEDIRLNGGQSENEGRVEVFVNLQWGTVCDDVWDLNDATVACKELGYTGAEIYFTNSHFGGGTGNIWLDNVECTGNETSLNDCEKNTIGENNCGHDEDAGVKCTPEATPVIGQVRLAGGSETAGRVEVYWEGEWGTVCDNGWDIEDANIVCNQLGFPSALSALSGAAFGEGSGPVHFDYVACFGGEPDLLRCSRSALPISCFHDQDAGVSCWDDGYIDAEGGTEQPPPTCEPLRSSLCQGMPYNLTAFPNAVGFTTQEEAEITLSNTFQAVIPMGCTAGFFQFMCLQFMPPCETIGIPTIPCKELCETDIKGCFALMEASSFPVPPLDLDCSLLPDKESGLCFAEDPSGFPYEDPNQDYRNDYRCGGDFLAPNGEGARCQKDGQYPCCSPAKWCGITSDHCDCAGCIDYRYHD